MTQQFGYGTADPYDSLRRPGRVAGIATMVASLIFAGVMFVLLGSMSEQEMMAQADAQAKSQFAQLAAQGVSFRAMMLIMATCCSTPMLVLFLFGIFIYRNAMWATIAGIAFTVMWGLWMALNSIGGLSGGRVLEASAALFSVATAILVVVLQVLAIGGIGRYRNAILSAQSAYYQQYMQYMAYQQQMAAQNAAYGAGQGYPAPQPGQAVPGYGQMPTQAWANPAGAIPPPPAPPEIKGP